MDTKEIATTTITTLAYLFCATYMFPLIAIDMVAHLISPKITSQEELEEIVLRQKKVLCLEKIIHSYLYPEHTACAEENPLFGEYSVHVGGFFANTLSVRHEMYHIKKDFCKKHHSELHYWLIKEPRAILYGVLGIKI